ncbi:FGGY family carbohydrate kinase [Sulfobacillus thermosulfidooxidans]|uniref:FGGY family carbohydrate kinase n=1 Tax=Sulfobacillus thermosulfidooxidans TaxID=28034 RepID=UPI0006B5D69B|nr:FGGY family carbohydrate kinase [Sulfobacillus thermosulfidooxidans]
MADNWLLGIDLGTTHIKAVAINRTGKVVFKASQQPKLYMASEGHFEQDPAEILQIVRLFITHCREQAHLESVAFSAAMHTFMVVDNQMNPVTKVWTWMDRRARPFADMLRQQGRGTLWYRLTGCPVHAMSPAVKWLAYSRFDSGFRPISLRDWIIYSLGHQLVTDYSIAAASGMMSRQGTWEPEILATLHLSEQILPSIHSWDYVVNDNILVGGSDGAMAHYGLNVTPNSHHGVLTWGTSAAIRITADKAEPENFMPVGNFAYFLGPKQGYLVGQALSNAGNVLVWASKMLGFSIPVLMTQGIEAINSQDSLPVFIPYLYGERSPIWDENVNAGFEGVLPQHQGMHFAGAILVSLLALLKAAYQRLQQSTGPLISLHVGPNLSHQSLWGQLVSQIVDVPLIVSSHEDASVWGAVKLAAHTQGWPVVSPESQDIVIHPVKNPRLIERIDAIMDYIR